MALATSANETQTGILGIGLDTDESAVEYSGKTYQNLPDVLVSEGKIGSKSYSLYLDNLGRVTIFSLNSPNANTYPSFVIGYCHLRRLRYSQVHRRHRHAPSTS